MGLGEWLLHGPFGRKRQSRKKLEWRIKWQSEVIKKMSGEIVELSRQLREMEDERVDQDRVDATAAVRSDA